MTPNMTPNKTPKKTPAPTTFQLTQLAVAYCAHSETGYEHPAGAPKKSQRGVLIKV